MDKLRKLVREEIKDVLNERHSKITGDHGNEIRVVKQDYDPNNPEGELMIRMGDEVIYLSKSKAEDFINIFKDLLNRSSY